MKISKYLEFKAFKKKFLSAHADCISMIFPDISTEKAKILKTNSTSTKTRIGKARESYIKPQEHVEIQPHHNMHQDLSVQL